MCMKKFNVPLDKPKPDIGRFLDAVSGKIVPDKPPMEEYLVDNTLMKPIVEDMLEREWVETSDKDEYMGGQMDFSEENTSTIDAWLDNQIAFWYHMGYDFVRVEVSLDLPAVSHITKDTAESTENHDRAWQGMEPGVIKTWEDFEKYPWPVIKDSDFYIHEYMCSHLPDGLGFVTCHAGGVYEHTSRLLGYEGLCYLLHDDPDLIKATADKLGELIFNYNKRLLQFDNVSVIFQGEDLGFNTQTLLPPGDIRKYFLVWHKKYSDMIHAKGKPYYIHSCGKIDIFMEEFIEDIKIDAKHSFQDNLMPVWEYKQKWGDRIGLLGGIDVHKLSTYRSDELRNYVRNVIEKCAPGGRFAVGAGNSIPSYIPLENYLTMCDEALR